MKILLKVNVVDTKTASDLAADPAVARATGVRQRPIVGDLVFPKFIDVESAAFQRVLDIGERGPGIQFLRQMSFTEAELRSAAFLELLPAAFVSCTAKEHELTWTYYKQLPLIRTGAPWPIKLLDRLYLARCRIKPRTFANYDQWTTEYVAGSDVPDLFAEAGLTGVGFHPVIGTSRSEPLRECHQVFATAILPPALRDVSVFETRDDGPKRPSTPRRYACLSYKSCSLAGRPDFARTAEPWGAWDFPSWVVRSRVRDVMLDCGVRARFQPVLEDGSALHVRHINLWTELLARLSVTPGHAIWA